MEDTKKSKLFSDGQDLLKKTLGTFEVDTTFAMPDGKEMKGKATARREPMIGGRFIRETFQQDMEGHAFEGEMVLCYSEKEDLFMGNWCDNSGHSLYPMKGKRIDENSFELVSLEPYPDMETGKPKSTRYISTIQADGSFTFQAFDKFVDSSKETQAMFMEYKKCEKEAACANATQTEIGKMNLTEVPVMVTFPETHYVYVEMVGPFSQTARQAWDKVHSNQTEITKLGMEIQKHLCLFAMEKEIYRAGVSVQGKPAKLPEGFQYVHFPGGKYAKFVFTGSYGFLPQAWPKVMEISKATLKVRGDTFYIEHYANNPKTTPEDGLISELYVPV